MPRRTSLKIIEVRIGEVGAQAEAVKDRVIKGRLVVVELLEQGKKLDGFAV